MGDARTLTSPAPTSPRYISSGCSSPRPAAVNPLLPTSYYFHYGRSQRSTPSTWSERHRDRYLADKEIVRSSALNPPSNTSDTVFRSPHRLIVDEATSDDNSGESFLRLGARCTLTISSSRHPQPGHDGDAAAVPRRHYYRPVCWASWVQESLLTIFQRKEEARHRPHRSQLR